jgi:hypothetical protein
VQRATTPEPGRWTLRGRERASYRVDWIAPARNVRAHRLEQRAGSSAVLIDQHMRQVQRIDGEIASTRGLRDGGGNRLLTTAGGELRSVQVHLEGTKS